MLIFSSFQDLAGKKWGKKALFGLLVAAVVCLGVWLRVYAANRLQIDYDEPVYLEAALEYNHFMREGRWTMLAWSETNAEHPVFYKILYGAALFAKPPIEKIYQKDFWAMQPIQKAPGKPWGMVGRITSVVFGGLATLVLALINPLAGFLFGIHSLAVKFTSSFYLEALPVFTTLVGMTCYQRWHRKGGHAGGLWLVFSAAFWGMAIASKYTYAVVPLAAGLHALSGILRGRLPKRALAWLGALCILTVLAFFICDPYLWRHTWQRLIASVTFHADYSQSYWVTRYDYPFYQPLLWFSAPFSHYFPATAPAFVFKIDPVISILAIAGLPRLYQRQQAYFYWLAIGMATLLLWPTKWPQYTMIVIAPLCLSAALGTEWVWEKLKAIKSMQKSRNTDKSRGWA